MQIVSISGLDGSGKSTQIDLLKNELEKNGQKVFYFHAVSFTIGNLFHKVEMRRWHVPATQKESRTSASWYKIFLRKIALIIDILRFSGLCKKLSSDHDYLLTDRYFYDQIVNILFLQSSMEIRPPHGDPTSSQLPWWQKLAENYIIKPDVAVYLQTSPETILKRDREIEQGKDYLEQKKKIYDFLGRRWGLKFINGEDDKNAVFAAIKSKL